MREAMQTWRPRLAQQNSARTLWITKQRNCSNSGDEGAMHKPQQRSPSFGTYDSGASHLAIAIQAFSANANGRRDMVIPRGSDRAARPEGCGNPCCRLGLTAAGRRGRDRDPGALRQIRRDIVDGLEQTLARRGAAMGFHGRRRQMRVRWPAPLGQATLAAIAKGFGRF